MDRPSISNSKIIYAILGTIIFSVLSFATVEVWSSSIIGISLLTIFLIWIIALCKKENGAIIHNTETWNSTDIKIIASLFAIPLYALIQILPIPAQILKIISYKTYELYTFYSLTERRLMTISLHPYKTLSDMMQIIYGITVFVPFYFLARNKLTMERVLRILGIFGFVLAFFALIQMATWNGKIYWIREVTSGTPFGPFVNRNHYAGFINMLILTTIGLAFTRKRKEKQILFGFFAVIMAVSVFMSLSRAGIISLIISITIFSVFIAYDKFRHNKKMAIAVFIVVLITYLIYLGIDPVIERFYRTDLTREERFTIWADAFKGAKDFILTGSGFGTFVNVFPLYFSRPSTAIYDHAHNDYLEFLIETGILGVILLILFLYFYIKNVIKGVWKGELGIIRISLIAAIISMLIHSIFDFNLHITSNLLLLSLISALLAASSNSSYIDNNAHDKKIDSENTIS